MSSDAPGQLLGYTLEIPRAVFHLLDSHPGDVVCIEFNGDVFKESTDGSVISEEDKSSVNSNPLTNKSTDLWKTFFNWITAVNDGRLNIDKTVFLLYTNKSGNTGIVNNFDDSKSKEEATKVISDAKLILADVDDKHAIWDYYDYVINKNEDILIEIIQRFELQVSDGAGFSDVEKILIQMHVNPNEIEFMTTSISGWVLKELMEKIAVKKLSMIKWEDFNKQVSALFTRIRSLELIDFTLREGINDDEIKEQVKIKPNYIKQLNAIGYYGDEVVEAVSDFLRAKVNRDMWIQSEIIDEDVAAEFQENLLTFWDNTRKRIEITERSYTEEERGELLLLDCKMRQQMIGNRPPPSCMIKGTYHALADEPILGWHPQWKSLLKK